MLRASQNAAQPEPTRLAQAMSSSTLARRVNGARASASERDSVATTSPPGSAAKVMRRVTRSRAASPDRVVAMVDHVPPFRRDRVTPSPVTSASSCAVLSSSSKPMTIQATGNGLRTATVTS